jgi:hypothetical protein
MASAIRRRSLYPWLAVILALLIGAPLSMYCIKRARLSRRLDAIRAAGDPLTLADLKPSAGADNDGDKVFAAAQKEIVAAAGLVRPLVNTEDFHHLQTANIDVHAIERIWQRFPTLLPTLNRLAECTRWTRSLDYDHGIERYVSSLAATATAHEASTLMVARALQLAAQGDPDAAVKELLKLFSIAAALDEEPTLTTLLISSHIRNQGVRGIAAILSWRTLGPATNAQIESALAHIDLNQAFERALKSERVVNLQLSMNNIALARETEAILDFDADQIAIARRPWSEVKPRLNGVPNRTGFWSGTPALNLLKPSIAKVHVVKNRGLALIRSLRVLNALAMRPDQTTADLRRLNLPADALVDPFDGKMLRIKSDAAGWLVYSVGENLVDDGGDITGKDCKDVGLALTRPTMNRGQKDQ